MKWVYAAFVAFLPFVSSAQDTGLVTCTGPDCNFCTFVAMVNNLIDWLVGFLTLAAVLALVFAGFKLVVSAGDQGAMTDAKKMITNIVIGFIIVLSAWLIVDTLMKALISTDPEIDAKFGVWNEINANQCGGINIPTYSDSDSDSESTALYCYDTAGAGTTNVHGLNACNAARAIAAGEGKSVGACYKCGD